MLNLLDPCRPVTRSERERNDARIIGVEPTHAEIKVKGKIPSHTRTFTFDRTFDVDASQEALFDSAVAPVVDEALRGYSCTVFAYGQTGTGKTYTMEGAKNEDGSLRADSEDAGIIVRAVRRVFAALEASGCEHAVKISFLEIYNEVGEERRCSQPACKSAPLRPPVIFACVCARAFVSYCSASTTSSGLTRRPSWTWRLQARAAAAPRRPPSHPCRAGAVAAVQRASRSRGCCLGRCPVAARGYHLRQPRCAGSSRARGTAS
jgi:hypothetical protein